LLPGNIIAVLVVNVDSIEVMAVDNVDKVGGEIFLSTKAVVPTVILVARP
jgi:hypothetical protein